MDFSRSIRSNPSAVDRVSRNLLSSKSDNLSQRSSSPPLSISSHRFSSHREQDYGKNEPLNDVDRKFYKVVFERCADRPQKRHITDREKFAKALSYVGYDLPKSKIDQHWSNHDKSISYMVFERTLKNEKPTDERTLEDAFQTLYSKGGKFDWNAVNFDRFRTDMLEKGDCLTEDEFEKLRSLLGTEHGVVNVKTLTKKIEQTKSTCRQKILKEHQEEESDKFERRLLQSSVRRSNYDDINIMIEPPLNRLTIPSTANSLEIKGAFFYEYSNSLPAATYLTIGYSFEIKRDGPIWITLEPVVSAYHKDSSFKNLDVRVLLFEKDPYSTERRLLHISSERSGNKSFLQLDELPRSSYEIIPVTFGGLLRGRSTGIDVRKPTKVLREIKNGDQFVMSRDYRNVLGYVFDLFDFDGNQQLDRKEYNLWTIRTTGDQITDEDWSSIRETINLDVDENISKENFFKLNDIEVKEQETTEEDLWTGLKSLGFNYALEIDAMCPFNLTVNTNRPDLHLKPTSFIELEEIKTALLRFLMKKAEKIKLRDPSVLCFNYQDDCGSILFIKNSRESNVQLSVQVTNSSNVALNIHINPRKPSIVNVRRGGTELIWFAHRLKNEETMKLDATIEIA